MAPTMRRDEIPTPALLLDLPAFEANIQRMTGYVAGRGKALRPHGKTHKCPEIARRLVGRGRRRRLHRQARPRPRSSPPTACAGCW